MEQRNKQNEQITTTRMYFDLPSFLAWVLSIINGGCIFYLLVGGAFYYLPYYLPLSALPYYQGLSALPLGQVSLGQVWGDVIAPIIVGVVSGAIAGGIVGSVQLPIVLTAIGGRNRSNWIVATAASWSAGGSLFTPCLANLLSPDFSTPAPSRIGPIFVTWGPDGTASAICLGVGIVGGVGIGVVQLLLTRRWLRLAGSWSFITAVSWIVGWIVGYLFLTSLAGPGLFVVGATPTLAAMLLTWSLIGLIVGIITGVALHGPLQHINGKGRNEFVVRSTDLH